MCFYDSLGFSHFCAGLKLRSLEVKNLQAPDHSMSQVLMAGHIPRMVRLNFEAGLDRAEA